jgi:hypothetical protein
MFPSEKVWKGVHNALHTRRRWYGIGLALLLLTAGTVTWVMMNPAPDSQQGVTPSSPATARSSAPAQVEKNMPGINTVAVVRKAPEKENSLGILPGLTEREKENVFPLEEKTSSALIVRAEKNITEIASPVPQTINNIAMPVAEEKQSLHMDVERSATTMAAPLPTIIDNPVIAEAGKKHPELVFMEKKQDIYPMSIESVVNSYKPAFRKKVTAQLYFTPTVSYRKLRENKSYLRSANFANNPSNLAALSDINSVVTHKPDMGLELGLSAGYQVTSVMKFKGGIQFNISRYDIKAFTSAGEIATIALNSGGDVVSVSTNLRNKGGYKANWLQNLYFSVSAPVGIEIKLGENGKTSLNVAGTLQPTYILSDRAYLISSDYKNYVEVPWLIRRWNMNTSFETFVTYSTGKLKWQVGPQVRYQLLSSFQEKYPVRENLFDFGLKVGIMLNR